MPDLLIDLFCEEIPARMQARACDDLKRLITDGLVDAGLTYASAAAFATPRRLALSVQGLGATSPDKREERKGPRTDAPQKALDGFLRATGLTRDQLQTRQNEKGEFFFATIQRAGRPAAEIVAGVLVATIRTFPWPKSMRWGAGSLKWVRPLQSILCILSDDSGATVVPLDVDGIASGDTTYGHRFMTPGTIKVSGFDDYVTRLKKAHVVLDVGARARTIWADATTLAFAQGLDVVEDKTLLAEVAGLVEWPVVLMGQIGSDFLDLPPEVLQTSMREHQNFFSVRNPKSGRIECFITVANIETTDGGATILAGNQKVLAARLSDARFFWENDLRVARAGMGDWTEALKGVTFHSKLGSQAERVERIAALAREIAPMVGADEDEAEQAARLSKADLMSEMVKEFPALQGIMGRYYAKSAGQSDAVAAAIEEHYTPLGPSDAVPSAPVSVAVALADKIDALTGFWAIELPPTASKDPFALRRAALGVVRLVQKNNVRMSMRPRFGVLIFDHLMRPIYAGGSEGEEELFFLETLRERLFKTGFEKIELAADKLVNDFSEREPLLDVKEGSTVNNLVGTLVVYLDDLLAFFRDRIKVYLRAQNIRHDIIDACIAMPNNDDLTLLVKRATALSDFLKTDDGENFLQGFKRANNILTQAEEKDGVEYSYGADVKFADSPEEKSLFAALAREGGAISSAIEAEDFAATMSGMAALRKPIDAFFEAVQVNTDNDIIRRNRLNLLADIRKLCLSVADLTRING
jgi:glycyl-tRNA synthetase beta chain